MKQGIWCRRLFGNPFQAFEPIKEAVAIYTQPTAEKLQVKSSICIKIRVSIRTDLLAPEEAQYVYGALVE